MTKLKKYYLKGKYNRKVKKYECVNFFDKTEYAFLSSDTLVFA